jgi:hypothetical protein
MCAGPRSFTAAGDAWQRRESGGRQRGDGEVAAVPVDKSMAGIGFQRGRARLTTRGTALKSTTLARPEARLIVLSAGPARWPLVLGPLPWHGGPARGTARFLAARSSAR